MNIKSFLIFLLIISYSAVSQAQEQNTEQEGMKTIFSKSHVNIQQGVYGAISLGYTNISGKNAFIAGGSGGWLIDHRFTVGLAGYGFVSNINEINHAQPALDNFSLAGGYGGLMLEFIAAPFKPVHVSFPVLIGGGGAILMDNQNHYENNSHVPYSTYFVLEPGIDVEINVVKFFRIALYGSYRYTNNVSIDYYSVDGTKLFTTPDNVLRGFNAGIKLKFGKF